MFLSWKNFFSFEKENQKKVSFSTFFFFRFGFINCWVLFPNFFAFWKGFFWFLVESKRSNRESKWRGGKTFFNSFNEDLKRKNGVKINKFFRCFNVKFFFSLSFFGLFAGAGWEFLTVFRSNQEEGEKNFVTIEVFTKKFFFRVLKSYFWGSFVFKAFE